MTDQVDPTALRRALGSYVTGVTVVTTRGPGGERAGLTVNSFSSVSLSPPLLLWSLALSAASFEVFEHASHFAVNVLGPDQIYLAEQFALSGGDKFIGVDYQDGTAGVPLLQGAIARFICRNKFRYPGGDHMIFVGEVISHQHTTDLPLVYARGNYRALGESLERSDERISTLATLRQKKRV